MATLQPTGGDRLHEELKTRIIKCELCVRAQAETFNSV